MQNTKITIAIPTGLDKMLEVYVAMYGGTKREVIADAIRDFLKAKKAGLTKKMEGLLNE